MKTSLKLRYTGPAVESGVMDVYQASANMIAFSEFVVSSAKASFGEGIEAKAEVSGFGRGSFITFLVFNIIGPASTIFSAVTSEHLLNVLEDAFKLWKHLQGLQPKAVDHIDSQTISVTNANGDIVQVKAQTLNIVFNDKVGDAVSKFIQEPLSNEGMDGVEIEAEGRRLIGSVSPIESSYFRSLQQSEPITDALLDMTLILESPVFKEGNKWRFSDGQASFYADILDDAFVARVNNGERFGKGDLLRVTLGITQQRSGAKVTTERTVLKVHEHRIGPEQNRLFPVDK